MLAHGKLMDINKLGEKVMEEDPTWSPGSSIYYLSTLEFLLTTPASLSLSFLICKIGRIFLTFLTELRG